MESEEGGMSVKYKVYARHITYHETEIEANDFNTASDIASGMDIDEFDEVDGEFYINGITEKEV